MWLLRPGWDFASPSRRFAPWWKAPVVCPGSAKWITLWCKMQEYPRYLYRAPFVVTGSGPVIADGAVLTENGLVAAVGSYAELQGVDAQLKDYEGHVITPSLVNC